jgi:hypothetical protein
LYPSSTLFSDNVVIYSVTEELAVTIGALGSYDNNGALDNRPQDHLRAVQFCDSSRLWAIPNGVNV